jgi:hypothetical protein
MSMYRGLLHVPRIDAILSAEKGTWSLAPDGMMRGAADWGAHLQWGADQLIECATHLRAGRAVAALAISRKQLERWTLNIAHHHGIEPSDDEKTAAYFTRVWSIYPRVSTDMGQAWRRLSDMLHGRDTMATPESWEVAAADLSVQSQQVSNSTLDMHEFVANTAVATFLQVRGGVRVLVQGDHPDWAQLMMNELEPQVVSDLPEVVRLALHPMDMAQAFSHWADHAISVARGYRVSMMQAARADRIASIEKAAVVGAFFDRRARAIERFRLGMRQEAASLADDFDPRRLNARLFRYITIAEAAEVVSYWCDRSEERASLRLAGSALRSAYFLWLEDTDVAMACARTLLESTCQARAWRLRPQRAERIHEASGTSSPARWIEAAGWRRAAILGRALGEYSHLSLRSRVHGARRLLEELQEADIAGAERRYTARGHALDQAAYLLAFEVIDRLNKVDDQLADDFRSEVTLMDSADHTSSVEELLTRAHDLKTFDFGEPDFRGPFDSERLTSEGSEAS